MRMLFGLKTVVLFEFLKCVRFLQAFRFGKLDIIWSINFWQKIEVNLVNLGITDNLSRYVQNLKKAYSFLLPKIAPTDENTSLGNFDADVSADTLLDHVSGSHNQD
jgi:hypothetical protein